MPKGKKRKTKKFIKYYGEEYVKKSQEKKEKKVKSEKPERARKCYQEDEDGYCTYDGICRHKDRNWKCQATDEDLLTHEEYLQTLRNSSKRSIYARVLLSPYFQ